MKGGIFSWRKNGGRYQHAHNLLTIEGAAYLSDNGIVAALFAFDEPKFYLALWGNDVDVLDTWTGVTFPATAGELNSTTEGFVELVRPQWTPETLALDGPWPYAENFLSPAEFNLRTATNLQICGAALLTSTTLADGADTLIAAVRFTDAPVSFDDHDILDIRYRLELEP